MDTVVRTLHQNWWLVLLQGVLSVVLGVLALAWPGVTLGALILLWGLFALLNGVVDVFGALGAASSHRSWGWHLAGGLVGILAGLAILRWPGLSALFVLYLAAIWAIIAPSARTFGPRHKASQGGGEMSYRTVRAHMLLGGACAHPGGCSV